MYLKMCRIKRYTLFKILITFGLISSLTIIVFCSALIWVAPDIRITSSVCNGILISPDLSDNCKLSNKWCKNVSMITQIVIPNTIENKIGALLTKNFLWDCKNTKEQLYGTQDPDYYCSIYFNSTQHEIGISIPCYINIEIYKFPIKGNYVDIDTFSLGSPITPGSFIWLITIFFLGIAILFVSTCIGCYFKPGKIKRFPVESDESDYD